MIIRTATVDDLKNMGECAEQFYASSRFLKNFNLDRFCAVWADLITKGVGVIFGLFDDVGKVCGAIGGVVSPDLYSGEPIAHEFYWFVLEGYRGKGIQMYRAFEAWARERECTQIQMVHLTDSMAEQLGHVYERLGFVQAEVRYTKELA